MVDLVVIYILSSLFFFSIFLLFYFGFHFNFILNLGKKYNVMLYIMVIQVTKCDMSQSQVTTTCHRKGHRGF